MKMIYIAGKYRAKTWVGKVINIWKARRVAERLWLEGWVVICPHMNTALFKESNTLYIEGDLEIVKRCDAIFMMKNWEYSEGANLEYGMAKNKGLEIYYD